MISALVPGRSSDGSEVYLWMDGHHHISGKRPSGQNKCPGEWEAKPEIPKDLEYLQIFSGVAVSGNGPCLRMMYNISPTIKNIT